MKIQGLKLLTDKGWNASSSFTNDAGKVMPIPANHKMVCQDENGDIVNLTIVTPVPATLKAGEEIKNLRLSGSVSRSAFGWTVKAEFIDASVK